MMRIDSPITRQRRRWALTLGLALAAAPVAGCSSDNPFPEYEYAPDAAPGEFTLQLLHASDMEAGAEAVEYAPRFAAILDNLRSEYPGQTVVLSSGDNYIPGPFFSASDAGDIKELKEAVGVPAPGRADILMLNAMGFHASALGNHEFDQGTGTVADLLQSEAVQETITNEDGEEEMVTFVYPGTSFPYLSVNLDFSEDDALASLVGASQQLSGHGENRVAGSTLIKMYDGELIGVVGATTPTLGSISTIDGIKVLPADEDGNTLEDDIEGLAELIQAEVDAIAAQGVNKIILLSHMQQLAVEKQLAGLLSGVDVIVAGGSNTILADGNDRLRAGDQATEDYPLELTSASDEPVLVVNTDGNYHYVGRLVVTFDASGVIRVGDLDEDVNGIYAADEQGLGELEPLEVVADIAAAVGEVIKAKDGNQLGHTTVYLEGERTRVRTEETNLGNLTAEANLAIAREVDDTAVVSIKNGGGIRAPIGVVTIPPGSTNPEEIIKGPPAANPLAGKAEGQISQLDIENALRFNNALTLLTLTAEQLHEVVEHAVAAVAEGATPGQFPQIAGMRFSFDPEEDAGKRVVNLVVEPEGGAPIVVVEDGVLQEGVGPFRVVTLSFLADGGDGYPFPTDAAAERLDLEGSADIEAGDITFAGVGTEQHALAKHLKQNFADEANAFAEAETPPAEDERIQNLAVRETDTVLPAL